MQLTSELGSLRLGVSRLAAARIAAAVRPDANGVISCTLQNGATLGSITARLVEADVSTNGIIDFGVLADGTIE